jgi:hypothetical protein
MMPIARREGCTDVEKISIQLIAERDGGYESGAGYKVPAGTFPGQISLTPGLLAGGFVSKTVYWRSCLRREKFP